MSEAREPIPSTIDSRPFPIGDAHPEAVESRMSLVKQLEALRDNKGEMQKYIIDVGRRGSREFSRWYEPEGGKEQMVALMSDWSATLTEIPPDVVDEVEDSARLKTLGIIAFQTGVALGREGLLPCVRMNCTAEMVNLAHLDRNGIKNFATESWMTMYESHPKLYSVISPWTQNFVEAMDARETEELVMIEASMALPYQMSALSRGTEQMKIWYERANAVPIEGN